MSTLVLQPSVLPVHPRGMKVTSFKGDDATLLDRLILASQIPTATPSSLQERILVPYFDSSDSAACSFAIMQQQAGSRHGAKPLTVPGLKRHAHERSTANLSGSPPKKENEVVQAKHLRQRGAAAAKQAASASTTTTVVTGSKGGGNSGSGSDSEMTSAPQHAQRKARSGKAATATTPQPQAGRKQGNKQAAATATADMRQLSAASVAAGAALRTPGSSNKGRGGSPAVYKFAGPAFTNSPMPDSLPIPTSSLLFQEAAEGLCARLTL